MLVHASTRRKQILLRAEYKENLAGAKPPARRQP